MNGNNTSRQLSSAVILPLMSVKMVSDAPCYVTGLLFSCQPALVAIMRWNSCSFTLIMYLI